MSKVLAQPQSFQCPDFLSKASEFKNEFTKQSNVIVMLVSARFARFTEAFVSSIKGSTNPLFLRHLRLLVAGSAYMIGKEMVNTVKAFPKAAFKQKIDYALSLISSIGTEILCAKIFSEGLVGLHLLPKSFAAKTISMYSIGATLEIAGVALEGKGLVETRSFTKEFDTASKIDKWMTYNKGTHLAAYREVRLLIATKKSQDQHFVTKYLWADESQLNATLDAVEVVATQKIQSTDPAENAVGENSLKTTLQALKERISVKKWSHALRILANSVGIIGIYMILSASTFTLGCGFSALGAAVALASIAYRNHMANKFNTALKLLS